MVNSTVFKVCCDYFQSTTVEIYMVNSTKAFLSTPNLSTTVEIYMVNSTPNMPVVC